MKLRAVFILLIFLNVGLYAQDTLEYNKYRYDKLAIGISPSSMLNNIGAFQISIDVGLTKRIRLSSELGYIYSSNNGDFTQGYRIKPSFEVLLYGGDDFGFQMGVFGLIRNFTENRKIRQAQPERYYEYTPVKRKKYLYGGGIAVSLLSRLTDNINMEIGAGLGNGKLTITDDKEINSFDFNWFFPTYDFAGEYSFPIIYFNFNFSYSIFK